jgi:hypothetical protein
MERRSFLRWFGVGAAAIAVPATSYAIESQKDEGVIGPVLLERVCDGGKPRMTAEEWERWNKESPIRFRGCGTRFRWYLGVGCVCPRCGTHFVYTVDDLKAKRFFVTRTDRRVMTA